MPGEQWRFYVGAGGAIAPPVFGFAPPVWYATKIVTMNNIIIIFIIFICSNLHKAITTCKYNKRAVRQGSVTALTAALEKIENKNEIT